MAGRFTFIAALVSCLLLGRLASGQEGYDALGASFSGAGPGQFAPGPHYAEPMAGPDAYCPPGAAGGYVGAGESRFGHAFFESVQQTWIRAEWLQWDIEAPGRQLMGAPLLAVEDPRRVFQVFDFSVPPNPLAGAYVPDLQPISFKDTNGVRLTFGIPVEFGQFEASAFMMEEAHDTATFAPTGTVSTLALGFPFDFTPPFIDGVPIVPAVTLLENGQPSNITLLYNEGLTISYESEIWGTEAVFVGDQFPFELAAPERGITARPIIGFRYLDVDERLLHVGGFRDRLVPGAPLLVSTIDSDADNDLYGGILGARLQFDHRWFTLGVEPRVTLGANNYTARVTTSQLRGFFDPTITTVEEETIFSPVLDLTAYARLHLHENFSLHVAYNALWMARVTRPHENIFFNDPGTTLLPPGVVVDAEIGELMLEGLSLGGEFRFR